MNKIERNIIIALIGCVAIVTIGISTFAQMYKNHQANQLIIEKCFDGHGPVVVEKGDSSPLVRCEK